MFLRHDLDESTSCTDAASEFDITHGVVFLLWKIFQIFGMWNKHHVAGFFSQCNVRRKLVNCPTGKKGPEYNQFLTATDKRISQKTVVRRLNQGELYTRSSLMCVPLSWVRRSAKVQWCDQHLNWTENDWICVLFSDPLHRYFLGDNHSHAKTVLVNNWDDSLNLLSSEKSTKVQSFSVLLGCLQHQFKRALRWTLENGTHAHTHNRSVFPDSNARL